MRNLEFDDNYFANRQLNDVRRMRSFTSEASFISKYASNEETICDVGCSTGEFLEFIGWKGKMFGIEINSFAANQAKNRGIQIIANMDLFDGEFDVIVMRGTIQHLPSPFDSIKTAFEKLRPGGILFILATPNIDSFFYRMTGNLPALDFPRNYWLPGFRQMKTVCVREGFQLKGFDFPYRNSGYASIWDFPKFLLRIITRNPYFNSAFPKNMMNLAFVKPLAE